MTSQNIHTAGFSSWAERKIEMAKEEDETQTKESREKKMLREITQSSINSGTPNCESLWCLRWNTVTVFLLLWCLNVTSVLGCYFIWYINMKMIRCLCSSFSWHWRTWRLSIWCFRWTHRRGETHTLHIQRI